MLANAQPSCTPLATATGRAAGIAFQARAIADEREVSALLASLALVSLHARFADAVGRAPLTQCLDGAGHVLGRLRSDNRPGRLGLDLDRKSVV